LKKNEKKCSYKWWCILQECKILILNTLCYDLYKKDKIWRCIVHKHRSIILSFLCRVDYNIFYYAYLKYISSPIWIYFFKKITFLKSIFQIFELNWRTRAGRSFFHSFLSLAGGWWLVSSPCSHSPSRSILAKI
jgi:hypothetical protein